MSQPGMKHVLLVGGGAGGDGGAGGGDGGDGGGGGFTGPTGSRTRPVAGMQFLHPRFAGFPRLVTQMHETVLFMGCGMRVAWQRTRRFPGPPSWAALGTV